MSVSVALDVVQLRVEMRRHLPVHLAEEERPSPAASAHLSSAAGARPRDQHRPPALQQVDR